MPELPEVEVVKRGLEKKLKRQMTLTAVEVFDEKLRFEVPVQFLKKLRGQKFLCLDRIGKFLIFEFENQMGFFSHLGMTGKWSIGNCVEKKTHLHLSLTFEDKKQKSLSFHYHDVRKFGFVEAFQNSTEKWAKRSRYGKDPLRDAWTAPDFWSEVRKSDVSIKVWLLDQKKIFGIGNIYASEILFHAGVRPQKKSKSITRLEAERILYLTREILSAAITGGGSSIRDFAQANGESGSYQDNHLVYGRAGEPCKNCGELIAQVQQSGRSTFWCRVCQR